MEYLLTLVSLAALYTAYRLGYRSGYQEAEVDTLINSVLDAVGEVEPETADRIRKDLSV